MPPKSQKEAPLTAELASRLEALQKQLAPYEVPTAEDWKALGNACFSNDSYLTAIRCYTKAIECDGGETAVLRSNRSAAYLKSSMIAGPSLALKDAEKAVELDENWFKAHLRVGDAQLARHKPEEALHAYERALALAPSNEAAAAGVKEAKKALFLHDLDQQEKMQRKQAADESDTAAAANAAAGDAPQKQAFTATHSGTWSSMNDTTGLSGSSMEGHSMRSSRGAEQQQQQQQQKRLSAPDDETLQLIHAWRQDISTRDDRTAMKPRTVTVGEADREAGRNYKQQMLQRFRQKLSTDDDLSATVRERLEREKLLGDGVDYRHAEPYHNQFAKATDGIGLGISADAYRFHTGTDKVWS